jgi:hypothetical protein
LGRTDSLARAGDGDRAVAELGPLLPKLIRAGDLYNAACVYAVVAAREPVGNRHAGQAVEVLRQAVAKGYKDAAHLKTDPDLAALRGRADFRQLVADLEAKAKAPPKGP